jgi:hypothetical protein
MGDLVKTGINIAEAIRKDSMYDFLSRQDEERSKICFFISHKEEDAKAAIELGIPFCQKPR